MENPGRVGLADRADLRVIGFKRILILFPKNTRRFVRYPLILSPGSLNIQLRRPIVFVRSITACPICRSSRP